MLVKWSFTKLFSYFITVGILIIRKTSTSTFHGSVRLLSNSEERNTILIFWHRDLALLTTFWQLCSVHVFSTLSKRGILIRMILKLLGHSVTLIPEGDRILYYKHISKTLEKINYPVVIAADGPFGPDHKVQYNILKWARDNNRYIIPLGISVEKYRGISKRWDKLKIPYIFNKAHIKLGSPFFIPSGVKTRDLVDYKVNLEKQLYILEQISFKSS